MSWRLCRMGARECLCKSHGLEVCCAKRLFTVRSLIKSLKIRSYIVPRMHVPGPKPRHTNWFHGFRAFHPGILKTRGKGAVSA